MRNWSLVLSAILLAGCQALAPTPAATPSLTPEPTKTVTPSPSPTPAPEPISVSSAARLSDAFEIGVGSVTDIRWLPDAGILLAHSAGVSRYDPGTLRLEGLVRPADRPALRDSALSHNGRLLASLVGSQTIRVWDSETGETVAEFATDCSSGPRSETNRLAFSSDDTRLFGCDGSEAAVWDIGTQEKIGSLNVRGPFERLLVSWDDAFLAVIGQGRVQVWDLAAEKEAFSASGTDAAVGHQTSLLAVANNTRATVYDMATGKTVASSAIGGNVSGIEFSPDDKQLALGSNYYQGVHIVDLDSGKVTPIIKPGAARLIRFGSTSSEVLLGWTDFALYTRNGSTYAEGARTGMFNPYDEVTFSPQKPLVGVAGAGSFVALWSTSSQHAVFPQVFAYGGGIDFSPDGTTVLTRAWVDDMWGSVQLWPLKNSSSGDVLEDPNGTWFQAGPGPEWCPSKSCVVSEPVQGALKVWSTRSREITFRLSHPGLRDYSFVGAQDVLATGGGSSVRLWDLESGDQIADLSAGGSVGDIETSDFGELAAATTAGVRLWNAETHEILADFKDVRDATHVAFGGERRLLAALGKDEAGNAAVFVWSTDDFQPVSQFTPLESPYTGKITRAGVTIPAAALLFSPDGTLLLTYSRGEYIKVWDAASGELVKTLDWFKPPDIFMPDSWSFSPDGLFVGIATAEGTIRILAIAP